MSDGLPTPAAHDGMGVVVQRRIGVGNEIVLVRNHERRPARRQPRDRRRAAPTSANYDTGTTGVNYQIGGNTNLVWRNGEWVDSYASLGGIYRPCAGGASAWGSWLSNEELRSNTRQQHRQEARLRVRGAGRHQPARGQPAPIVDMGRFAHEASAIDPATGVLVPDRGPGRRQHAVPLPAQQRQRRPGSLHAGGRLQRAEGQGRDERRPARLRRCARSSRCEWVDIAEPRPRRRDAGRSRCRQRRGQRPVPAGLRQRRGDLRRQRGLLVADGIVYFSDSGPLDTQPAAAARGCMWALDLATGTLKAIFVSDDILIGNSPDNICVSPRGGVLFCEDGGNGARRATRRQVEQMRLMGVTPAGASYVFAKHNFNFTAAQLAAAGKSTLAATTAIPSGRARASAPTGTRCSSTCTRRASRWRSWGPGRAARSEAASACGVRSCLLPRQKARPDPTLA